MSNVQAFKSTRTSVLLALADYTAMRIAVQRKRNALSDTEGRNLMIRRVGFGHGDRVVGFERFDSDESGDLLSDGSLIVSSRSGANNGMVVPNLRRKSGKAYAEHLKGYDSPGPDLPGCPSFHMDGFAVGAPGLWAFDGTVYAMWESRSAVPMGDEWTAIPLSEYYTAKEAYEAATVSGNEKKTDG